MEGENYQNPLLLEHRSDTIKDFEFELKDAVITPTENATARVVLANRFSFTQVVGEGCKLGQASEVIVMAAAEESTDAQAYSVGYQCFSGSS